MSSSRHLKAQGRRKVGLLHNWSVPDPSDLSTSKIEEALRNVYQKNVRTEQRMKELETRLTEDLSNFRAVDGLINEVYSGLQRNCQRAETSLNQQVPQIQKELEASMETLNDLAETLPTTRKEVAHIRQVYQSGREKAKTLVSELTWLNTEFYERWRTIIFTSSSPVSWRWKIYMRTLFVVSFIICSWLFWIALTGAYRAHRHRLVWGEKLMS